MANITRQTSERTERAPLNPSAVNASTDRATAIQNRLARRIDRITQWDREAERVETWWNGASDYRMFCEAMAAAARLKKIELEAELKHLERITPTAPTSAAAPANDEE